jgi:hypothetical protein
MSGNLQDENKQLPRRWFEEGRNQFDALGLMHQAGAIEFKTGGYTARIQSLCESFDMPRSSLCFC